MRSFLLATACFLAAGVMALAQAPVVEMNDPHPTSPAVWNNVKSTDFGWGSIDLRYKKDDVPALYKAVALHGWRGERVNAQAVLVTPVAVKSFQVSSSDLRFGRHYIPSDKIKKGDPNRNGVVLHEPDKIVKMQVAADEK